MAIKSNLDTGTISSYSREFVLPSGGILYRKGKAEFPNSVVVEPFSFSVEGIMTTNLHYYEKLQLVAERVVTNFPKDFDFGKLLIADVVAIMTLARGLTYGETYRFSTTCPACEAGEQHTIKIPDELPVKNWNYTSAADLEANTMIELPRIKDKIALRFLTLSEEKELTQAAAATRKQISEDAAARTGFGDLTISRIARRIKTVNGTVPDNLTEAVAYVRRITGPDMVALNDGLDAAECGIDFTYLIECAKCKYQYSHKVPMAMDFFRRWGR